jgi:HD-like signal output (HDOD) protein
VAALAVEIAGGIPAPAEALAVVQQAALLHHASSFEPIGPAALHRMLQDLLPTFDQSGQDDERRAVPLDVTTVLCAFRRFPADRSHNPGVDTLAQVLFVSNLMDEQLEMLAWVPVSPFDVWESLAELSGLLQPQVMRAAHKTLRSSPRERATCLPLQTTIAKDLFQTLIHQRPDSVTILADLVARDPDLAARFLQAANALIGGNSVIRSLRRAITQLGTGTSRKLILALSIRPIFADAQMEGMWGHSLQMAAYLGAWAGPKGLVSDEEALLLGLVHDVGSVALQGLPEDKTRTFRRLCDGGWAPQCAELLLLGSDHGDLGASLLASWGLSTHLTDAVEAHHRPADSDSLLASALYASGYWLEQDEDLPSPRHLRAALKRIGCSIADLSKVKPADAVLSAAISSAA